MWEVVGHWSYTGDPASSDRDAVRFLVQDTNSAEPLISDEEVDFALAESASTYDAGALVCEVLARRFAQEADRSVSANGVSTSYSYSSRVNNYRELAKELRARASAAISAIPYLPARSLSEKDAAETDTDRTEPMFRRDMWENS